MLARLLGAGLVLLPLGWWLSREQRLRHDYSGSLWGLSPLPLRTTVLTGTLGGLIYALVAYSGFVYAPAAHASVLLPGSLPLWTSVLALLLMGDRMTAARALGLTCIVGGDLLVGGDSLLHALDGSGVWRGDLLFVVGAMAWSFYSVLVRKLALAAVQATTAITVFAFLVYVPVYLMLLVSGLVPGHFLTAPVRDIVLQMAMQGVGSVLVSGITFNVMIRHYGPVRSTMVTALVPGLSALSAALLLHEPLPWNVLCGLTLVTMGIVFGVRKAGVSKP